MKLNLEDKKVIQAFFNKKQFESRCFTTDGFKLNATWGEQVAEWLDDQIVYNTESKKTKQILDQVKSLLK
jgi:hypothetical protein